ncbi:16S rRNA (uracil(1498)-N(3))-methyltransferase [Candidatus Peregrinibacteria bacterium]|jgi:16S rRNA (uracil1498-N3)-methyltransferase|nr:16S rRNA (uracil(1498)-N(3))-methyltransferase [Candidatus Peregrinibacteria bacterium]MBT4631995.1 16S rRNA (uracil(1498)-N(3))-methyltransferase [Candidatus Peregrinibacteria bacterium]MBT5516417.1 16S rRNA (uracil(1498)-N(3))-methyltransferase [Candidatus Peregrinibacteria bacterium]MBT5823802.1 16S rRNA (uracil(1498)-N(3))-methyltransferase [Candidatus Peregrinibacteria bacterium]
MQHFILKGIELRAKNQVEIRDKEIVHQMIKVLRFRAGDKCVILDGLGEKADGEILELHKKGAVIALSEHSVCVAPKRRVRLCVALSKKPATFELIVQKAVELGVTDIIPIVSERCQASEIRKPERLDAILREACEQSERCFLPKMHEVLSLGDFLENLPSGTLLAGDARDTDGSLKDMDTSGNINLLIGPEGGFTENELGVLRSADSKIFLLGDTVLRMETAAIAALAIVLL